jgi:hypothetical protein
MQVLCSPSFLYKKKKKYKIGFVLVGAGWSESRYAREGVLP